jgi:Predicted AAA-ATPase
MKKFSAINYPTLIDKIINKVLKFFYLNSKLNLYLINMERESKKIQLYNKLIALECQNMESNSEELATGEGINSCLVEIFENEAHIIHPNLLSIEFPVITKMMSGIVSYIEILQKLIIVDEGELKKPIIVVWNANIITKEQKIIKSQSLVGAHWQTLVILPKHYITFDRRALGNPNELVFFKDPCCQGKFIPKAFKNLLKSQISFASSLDGDQNDEEVKIGGVMRNAEFHDRKYTNAKQQTDEFSSGWWAVYNAVMFVMTGSDDFMDQFSNITENLGNKLRYVFENLNLQLNQKSETFSYKKKLNKKNKNTMNEAFESSTDSLNFELYSVLSGNYNKETAEKFQINTRNDLIYYPSPDSFKILVGSDVYVDKTLLIKEIIDTGPSSNILITRPRRWGKTLNLDMISTFFEIEVDEQGKFNLENPNKNRELFEGSKLPAGPAEKKILKKLKIAEVNNGEYLIHQGKYPVIFVTFSSVRKDSSDSQDIFKSIRSSIARAFRDHILVLYGLRIKFNEKINKIREENKNLSNEEITKLIKINTEEEENDILKFNQYLDNNSKESLDTSIFFLSMILRNYFKKEVYILIDEYDAPLNSSFGDSWYDSIKDLMRSIIGTSTKNNKYLKKAIITGILKISKANLFSGLNNIIDYGVLHPMYSEYFGFTEGEVNELLSTCLIVSKPKDKRQFVYIKMCYNGYKIGNHTVYNPWSIMRCLERARYQPLRALQCYWADSGDFSMIKKAFGNLAKVEALKPLIKNYRIETSISELVDLSSIGENFNDLLSLLLQSGYLTEGDLGEYRIPNLEVLSYFYRLILPVWIEKNIGLNNSVSELVESAINTIENGKKYKQVIKDKLLVLVQHTQRTEFDFQILLGAPLMLAFETKKTKHAPYSEVYTANQKKIDTLFVPIKGKSKIVIIHEYKKAPNDGTGINEVLEEAVWQIYVNQYISKPIFDKKLNKENDYWETIVVRAIAFFKKRLGSWGVEIKEFVHTFNQAEKLNQIFSINGKLLQDSKELISKKSTTATSDKRKIFLSNHRAKNIFELINRYTGEEISEGPIKKAAKIESENQSILRIERENLEYNIKNK